MGSDLMLLTETCGWAEMVMNESTGGKCIFRGKMQEAEKVNENKRKYSYEVLNNNLERLMESMKARGLYGELDHPTDSIIHLKEASHLITKLWWEGNILMGEGEVLPTPAGMVMRKIMEAGGRIGMSSRGIGSGEVNNEGILEIKSSYRLISFDCVASPSTSEAYQERVVTKKENYVPSANYQEPKVATPKLNTEAFISYFGCLTEEYKQKQIRRIRK